MMPKLFVYRCEGMPVQTSFVDPFAATNDVIIRDLDRPPLCPPRHGSPAQKPTGQRASPAPTLAGPNSVYASCGTADYHGVSLDHHLACEPPFESEDDTGQARVILRCALEDPFGRCVYRDHFKRDRAL